VWPICDTYKTAKNSLNHVKGRGYNKNCLFIHTLDVIEGIFAVLYVPHIDLTHCYKTVVFLHLFEINLPSERNVNETLEHLEEMSNQDENQRHPTSASSAVQFRDIKFVFFPNSNLVSKI